jgi:hypothetical protein
MAFERPSSFAAAAKATSSAGIPKPLLMPLVHFLLRW